jgi:hypothetical protein
VVVAGEPVSEGEHGVRGGGVGVGHELGVRVRAADGLELAQRRLHGQPHHLLVLLLDRISHGLERVHSGSPVPRVDRWSLQRSGPYPFLDIIQKKKKDIMPCSGQWMGLPCSTPSSVGWPRSLPRCLGGFGSHTMNRHLVILQEHTCTPKKMPYS